jgi:hypothetical protein
MGQTVPFPNPDESRTALPSTSVVEMFGRFFGTILARLFENNTLKASVLQQPLSQIQSSFTESQSLKQSSTSPGDFPSSVEEDLSVLKTEIGDSQTSEF